MSHWSVLQGKTYQILTHKDTLMLGIDAYPVGDVLDKISFQVFYHFGLCLVFLN